MKRILHLMLFFCSFSTFLIGLAPATGQEQGCTVKIVSPSNDDRVGEVDDVKGTGAIPAGTYLWVFAHRRGLALWWPEGGGAAVITKGAWLVTATFGQERDNGRQFEIAAVVVDRATNAKLENWVTKAGETGQYPGMNLPAPVEGCNLQQVTVTKR
ncbi:MAG TPA: hypothetical protein VNX26_01605 [Candidatus Acidoferrum sp.]|jgi:hypothetical protein|nr:hypothetical protein [Candidatus Acidoferrum sp.]